MSKVFLCFLCVVLLVNVRAAYSAIEITDTIHELPLTEHLQFLEDTSGKLTIEDVSSMSFIPPPSKDNYYGISDASFWFKFTLNYASQRELKRQMLIELGFPLHQTATLYSERPGGRFEPFDLGQHVGFGDRPISYRNPLFPITLTANSDQTFYLNIKRESGLIIAPIVLWSQPGLLEKVETETVLYGLFYGAIGVMFFYNLFLWLSIRDSAYIFYLCYLASTCGWFAVYNGFAFKYWWPDLLPDLALPTFGILANLFVLAFARSYIKFSRYSILFDRLIISCIVLWISFLLFMHVTDKYLLKEINYLMGLIAVILPAAIIYCISKGSREAKFFFLAWSLLILAGTIQTLFVFKLVPLNFVSFYGMQIATLFESILLSLALADRINTANAKIKAQDDQYRVQLEQDVRTRTIELIKANLAAKKANRVKSHFLAAASHDLRQPLQAISLNIYTLKMLLNSTFSSLQDYAKSRRKEVAVANNLERSTTLLTTMLDGILDISKLESGVIKQEIHYFSIVTLIETLVIEFRPLAEKKNIELLFSNELGDCQIESDSLLCDRILRNLIENAIKYTEHGVIQITLKQTATDELVISVQDTGIGIHTDQMDSIFDEFVQIENSERNASNGFGLGLASVKHLCKLLNIRISVESELDVGSSFYLHINDNKVPFIQVKSEEILKLSTPQSNGKAIFDRVLSLKGMRVLLVDDDSAVVQSLERLLTSWECEVTVFQDYHSAEQCTLHHDALILDYRLPNEKKGIALANTINQFQPTPTLIITGDTGRKPLRELKNSGYSFCNKPIPPDKLKSFLLKSKKT